MAQDPKALYAAGVEHFRAGRLPDAKKAFEAVLAVAPKAAEPMFQMGRVLAAQSDKAGAERLLRKALKLQPQTPAIWQALHGVLTGGAAKKLEREARAARIPLGTMADVVPILKTIATDPMAAEAQARAVAKKAPAAAAPAYALGLARLALGQPAVTLFETALDRDTGLIEARLPLARAYHAEGRPMAGLARLDGETGPDAAIARAQILRETGQMAEAVTALRAVPPNRAVFVNLALTYAAMAEGAAATDAFERAVKQGADHASLARAIAAAAEEAWDIKTAETILDTALAAQETAPLLTHRAQLAQSAGDIAGADPMLRRAMAIDPKHGPAYRSALTARKVDKGDSVATATLTALNDPSVAATDRADMHFAAAKAAFDQRRDADAASHLTTANRLIAKLYPYNFDADLVEARALLKDWDTLETLSPVGPEEPVIFVTGLPRSGTTLIETILAAHPETATGGEMPFLNRALSPVFEALRHGGDTAASLAQAGPRYLTMAHRRAGPGVVVDKAISTFSRIGHTLRSLPAARIVLVRREPRDIALSLFRNRFPDGLHRYAYDLNAMGRYIRLHAAITAAWQDRCPDRICVVDYEALTADPEPQIRRLLDAVKLPFNPACLAPQDHAGRIQTLSFAQARQPIGRDAVATWKRFEDMLAPAIAAFDNDVTL